MSDQASFIVTVLGGGGFIGRYACEELLRAGAQLRVAQRDPRGAWFLQPLGKVGQVSVTAFDMRRLDTIERALEDADAVVNLVGAFDGDLEAIHVSGPRRAAELAARCGAKAFVHLSAIGADPASTSRYGRTKGEGEQAVHEAFPNATILRPSLVFGAEDQLTNRFAVLAGLPLVPVIAPRTRFQPVFVRDVAAAAARAVFDPNRYGGGRFDLGGPEILSMRRMVERIAALAGRTPALVDMPDFAARALASLGFLPGAPLTKDQWQMLQHDNIPAPGAKGLDAFDIVPTALDAVAPEWLGRFVKGGRFARRTRVAEAGT